MTIWEAVGSITIIYLVATSLVGHAYLIANGCGRIIDRTDKGKMHEVEANRTLLEMRYPERYK